jgi:hypothetical protein
MEQLKLQNQLGKQAQQILGANNQVSVQAMLPSFSQM